MGEMARVICGLMNFSSLRFVPSKKKKKKKPDPFVSNVKDHGILRLNPFFFFCVLKKSKLID